METSVEAGLSPVSASSWVNTVFKALNDKTRREILEMLRKKDMSAGEIAEKFHIAKPY